MVQTAVPDSDITAGNQGTISTTAGGGTYYTEIDDGLGAGSESTYVTLSAGGTTAKIKVGLESLSTPQAGTRSVKIHARNNGFGTDSLDVLLDDGTDTETVTINNISTSFSNQSATFTTDFNWSSLTAQLIYTTNFFSIEVAGLEVEIPDAGGGGGGAGPKLNPEAFLMFL